MLFSEKSSTDQMFCHSALDIFFKMQTDPISGSNSWQFVQILTVARLGIQNLLVPSLIFMMSNSWQWVQVLTAARLGRSTHLLLTRPARLWTNLLHVVGIVSSTWHRRNIEATSSRCWAGREHLTHLLTLGSKHRAVVNNLHEPALTTSTTLTDVHKTSKYSVSCGA